MKKSSNPSYNAGQHQGNADNLQSGHFESDIYHISQNLVLRQINKITCAKRTVYLVQLETHNHLVSRTNNNLPINYKLLKHEAYFFACTELSCY